MKLDSMAILFFPYSELKMYFKESLILFWRFYLSFGRISFLWTWTSVLVELVKFRYLDF